MTAIYIWSSKHFAARHYSASEQIKMTIYQTTAWSFGGRRGQVVSASARRPGGPRFKSRSRLSFANGREKDKNRSIALSQNGWMDARA